ncbi:ABC transporter permease [Oscillochloris sp. ZM17-4]|uniref:ABC transporter permease n=1 Tax=Oscillochloris sp. ZM17-4 TaxID=2866714 RepID=UPI001C736532|nr:ABC transporter permease [Oscillochloris sp. ZM17-4]MBX0329800.1 ABC transporter permease [Oscillochloris sp. ZM17-4]
MSRSDYIIRRIGMAALTVVFAVVMNFFLFRVLPGDPAKAGIRDPRLTAAAQQSIRERFGLDKPLLINLEGNPFDSQFFRYFGNLLQGDLGISYNFNRPVADLLRERLINTVLLVGVGEVLAIIIGVALGLLAAWRRGTAIDVGVLLFGLFTWALPTFFLAIILLIIGSTFLGLPVAGIRTAGGASDPWSQIVDVGRHMMMPTLTLTIILLGEFMLIMRSSLLEVLSEDYILTAKAKGLSDWVILRDHAMRNAMLPMIALIALTLGFTVSGSILIESVFSWPGLGSAVFEAVGRRDFPMLQGAFMLFTVSVILANTAADLLYAALDPRVSV